MSQLNISFSFLLLLPACMVHAQDAQQPPQWRGYATVVQPIDCSKFQTPAQGLEVFEDDLTGIRFDYPAYLKLNETDLSFESPTCGKPFKFGGAIGLEVTLPEKYRESFYVDRKVTTIGVKTVNGMEWKHYTAPSAARMCAFANGEQVCIVAVDTSPEHRVPAAAVEAMKSIEASFAFTDPAKRMDAKIAALKPGDRVGGLVVWRVIPRAMIQVDRKRYEAGGYDTFGEVDFGGMLMLAGGIEDVGTMNSRGQFRLFPDSDEGSQLPFNVNMNLGDRFVFDYSPSLEPAVKVMTQMGITYLS